jgi:hypothetical protein
MTLPRNFNYSTILTVYTHTHTHTQNIVTTLFCLLRQRRYKFTATSQLGDDIISHFRLSLMADVGTQSCVFSYEIRTALVSRFLRYYIKIGAFVIWEDEITGRTGDFYLQEGKRTTQDDRRQKEQGKMWLKSTAAFHRRKCSAVIFPHFCSVKYGYLFFRMCNVVIYVQHRGDGWVNGERGCIQKFPDWVDNEITTINTRWEATRRVMAAKLTRLTHKIAIQLHSVAESCTIGSSRSRRPVRKLLYTPSYTY